MLFIEITMFAFVACASPGPVNLLASISGAKNGIKVNIPFVLGATLGLSFVIIVAGLGIGQILQSQPVVSNILTVVGSGYMLYLAYKLAKENVHIDSAQDDAVIPGFNQGAILQIINPKAWLVSMTGLALYLKTGEYSTLLIIYVIIFFCVCFASVLLWVSLGHLLSTKLPKTFLNIFNKLMAGLLAFLIISNLINTFSEYFTH